jgi:hypothetical protein
VVVHDSVRSEAKWHHHDGHPLPEPLLSFNQGLNLLLIVLFEHEVVVLDPVLEV